MWCEGESQVDTGSLCGSGLSFGDVIDWLDLVWRKATHLQDDSSECSTQNYFTSIAPIIFALSAIQ